MFIAAGLVTLALGFASQEPSDETRIGYQVNVYEMQGLEWRGELQDVLQPLGFESGATVWTAPASAISRITGKSSTTLFSPKPTTGREVPAEVQTSLHRNYVAHLERVADGPRGKATALSYNPRIEGIEEWLNVVVDCYKTDEGVLTQVAIDEQRLAGMNKYIVEETLAPAAAQPGAPVEQRAVAVPVQVPELVRGGVEGEWMVAPGHVLIVGLGVHSSLQESGERTLLERVAVIQPNDAPSPVPGAIQERRALINPIRDNAHSRPIAVAYASPAMPVPAPAAPVPNVLVPTTLNIPGSPTVIVIVAGANGAAMPSPFNVALPRTPFVIPLPAQPLNPPVPIAHASMPEPAPIAAAMPMPMPPTPQRMLPTPLNSKGEVMPLPPLPAVEAEPEDASAEPHGSSQTPHVKPEAVEPRGDVVSITAPRFVQNSHHVVHLLDDISSCFYNHDALGACHYEMRGGCRFYYPMVVFETPRSRLDEHVLVGEMCRAIANSPPIKEFSLLPVKFKNSYDSAATRAECTPADSSMITKADCTAPCAQCAAKHDEHTKRASATECQSTDAPAKKVHGTISLGISTGKAAIRPSNAAVRIPVAPFCTIDLDAKLK